MRNLTLNVKKKWFDMILSGVKKEEYREIKKLYINKFEKFNYVNLFDTVTFLNGMKKETPTIVVECVGISVGKSVPEWSDNWQGDVYVISLGKIISTKNVSK